MTARNINNAKANNEAGHQRSVQTLCSRANPERATAMTQAYFSQRTKVSSRLEVGLLPEGRPLAIVWWARLRQAKRKRDAAKAKADGKASVSKTYTLMGPQGPRGELENYSRLNSDLWPTIR